MPPVLPRSLSFLCASPSTRSSVRSHTFNAEPKILYQVEVRDWNAIYDACKDGGVMVKCLGQLDTYGPLCDDAAQVKLTIEGRTLPDGKTFMGPIEKVVSSLNPVPRSIVSYISDPLTLIYHSCIPNRKS